MTYWEEVAHPALLPDDTREAWHRDAWDREQTELYWLAQSSLIFDEEFDD